MPTNSENPADAYKRRLQTALEDHVARQEKKRNHVPQPKASDYTTKAGLAYGKSLGWAVLAVEEDRAYKKQGEWVRRKQDLKFAVDIIFRTPDGSVIGVQCGGRYEEPAHRRKFEGLCFGRDVGALYSAVRYWGFDRGEAVPVVVREWWPEEGL